MRLLKAIAVTALLLCSSSPIRAQAQTVEIADLQLSSSLSGLVQDPAGTPIPNAMVQELSSDWKRQLRSTQSDSIGVFSLAPVQERRIYYLQVSARGFNPLRVRVQVDPKRGGKLRLKLYLAT
jgi:Carboxypeptidase regulatory-like domain